jgi:hypothetical protein
MGDAPTYKLTDEQRAVLNRFVSDLDDLIGEYSGQLREMDLADKEAVNSCVIGAIWSAMRHAKASARDEGRKPSWRYWVGASKQLWRAEEVRGSVVARYVWEWIETGTAGLEIKL